MKTFPENLPMQRGHFVLESGLHTDFWITMDALFIDPRSLEPHITALSELLKPYDITALCGPMLFLSGSRDELADLVLLEPVCKKLSRATLHILDTADHGFRILKRSRKNTEDVFVEMAHAIRKWIS